MKRNRKLPFLLKIRLAYNVSELSKFEKKSCPIVFPAFSPYEPAMLVDNSFHRSKTDSRSLEFLIGMQAAERFKQPVHIRHIETYTIVSNEISDLTVFVQSAELEYASAPAGR